MARRIGRLEAAGYRLVPGTSEGRRRYIDPEGRNVSYRQAFQGARGESLEAAVHDGMYSPTGRPLGRNGTYRDEYRVFDQIRSAARNGQLAGVVDIDGKYVTKREERELAGAKFRATVKGHFISEATKEGVHGRPPERVSLYGRLLGVLHAEDDRNESGNRVDARGRPLGRNAGLNAAHGAKALLLIAMGRRDPEAEYAVGDSP